MSNEANSKNSEREPNAKDDPEAMGKSEGSGDLGRDIAEVQDGPMCSGPGFIQTAMRRRECALSRTVRGPGIRLGAAAFAPAALALLFK